jgi:phage/plasmid-associated DNA primase
MELKIYSLKTYSIKKEDFEKVSVDFETIDEIVEELKFDKSYHFRVKNKKKYIFFGDLDGFTKGIDKFKNILISFFKEKYNLNLSEKEIFFTENDKNKNSFHYSIPKWNLTTENLKVIHQNLLNDYIDYFISNEDGKIKHILDTSIYSDHWFRCPEQTKSNKQEGIHKIIHGTMKDFVIEYIPENSQNIDHINYINTNLNANDCGEQNKKIKNQNTYENFDNNIINKDKNKELKFIDSLLKILNADYYDDYNEWYKIGMILKKKEKEIQVSLFDLFDNFSKKSKKYNYSEVKKYWDGFDASKITITLGSLNEYAKKSDSSEYKKITKEYYSQNKIEITEKYICETLSKMASQYFFYKDNILYSFDIHNKMWYSGVSEIMKKFINDELYDYLFELLNDCISDESYLHSQIKQLKNYCLKNKGQDEIMKAYRMRYLYQKINIEFDSNPYLLGFSNGVYDLKNNIFRDYEYNDYMTTNTGYLYQKASNSEIESAKKLIEIIELDSDKRDLLYQIYASGLIGKSFEKFFIFNGSGRNGKSKLTDMMECVLGNYFTRLNLGLLCGLEKKIDSSNEHTAGKNLIDKKRFCVFSEPDSTRGINNGKMKDLTGNKNFIGRKMHTDEKFIINNHGTFILECNKKPKLTEDATSAESERIVDFLFESRFTLDDNEINEEKKVFRGDVEIGEKIVNLKYGFLNLLIDKAYNFINIQNLKFIIPSCVKNRSKLYIASSYAYLDYLNEVSEKSSDNNNYITIKELYNRIKRTDLYINSTKQQKREINFKSLVDFFSSNDETKYKYKSRYKYDKTEHNKEVTNVLLGYVFVENNLDEDS